MRRCWVNFQCQGVLLTWLTVGQGPIVLSVGASGGCLDIFSLIYHFSFLSPSLRETARYRLKYCLKGLLSQNNQPTNSTGIISVLSQRSLLASGISRKRKADSESEKTVSSDQPAQKKCKTNSGSGSASNSRVFQPQWVKQFDWLEYDSETAEHECINLGQ